MEKYELDGEVYYFTGSLWVDSKYTVVKRDVLGKLNNLRTANISFETEDFESLLKKADEVKNTDDYIKAIAIYEKMLEKTTEYGEIRKILPRYSSMLRKEDKSRKAIQVYEKYYEEYGKSIDSPALYTSIVAAYCDIGDTDIARKMANRARAMSGGNNSPELISVYSRIKMLEK